MDDNKWCPGGYWDNVQGGWSLKCLSREARRYTEQKLVQGPGGTYTSLSHIVCVCVGGGGGRGVITSIIGVYD